MLQVSNGSDDEKNMCSWHGSCRDLYEYLKCHEKIDLDPFKGIPVDEVSCEGILLLTIDPDNSDEFESVIMDELFISLRSNLQSVSVMNNVEKYIKNLYRFLPCVDSNPPL